MSVCTIRSALNQVPFSTQWWGTPPSPPSTVEEYSPLLDISCILQCPPVVTNTSPAPHLSLAPWWWHQNSLTSSLCQTVESEDLTM